MAKDRFNTKPGVTSSGKTVVPLLSPSLYKAAMILPPEPKKAVKEKKVSRPIKIPDETVLAIRRLSRDGMHQKQIEKLYPDLKPNTINQFITYATRTNLLLPEDRIKKQA